MTGKTKGNPNLSQAKKIVKKIQDANQILAYDSQVYKGAESDIEFLWIVLGTAR